MLILFMLLLIAAMIIKGVFTAIWTVFHKIKNNKLLESINGKEDLLYMNFNDYLNVVTEVLRRKGCDIKDTDRCGEEGNGLLLNNLQYAEIWKHGMNKMIDVETAMNLAKCMQVNSIYKGMLVTLGDFKHNTKIFCHKNVIECINGDRLLEMCKEVQKRKEVLEVDYSYDKR